MRAQKQIIDGEGVSLLFTNSPTTQGRKFKRTTAALQNYVLENDTKDEWDFKTVVFGSRKVGFVKFIY